MRNLTSRQFRWKQLRLYHDSIKHLFCFSLIEFSLVFVTQPFNHILEGAILRPFAFVFSMARKVVNWLYTAMNRTCSVRSRKMSYLTRKWLWLRCGFSLHLKVLPFIKSGDRSKTSHWTISCRTGQETATSFRFLIGSGNWVTYRDQKSTTKYFYCQSLNRLWKTITIWPCFPPLASAIPPHHFNPISIPYKSQLLSANPPCSLNLGVVRNTIGSISLSVHIFRSRCYRTS